MSEWQQQTAASQGVPQSTPVPPSGSGRSGSVVGKIEATPLAAGVLVIGAVVLMGGLRRVFRGVVL